MKVQAIRTHRVRKNEHLLNVLDQYLPALCEGTIIAITSKLVSICQGAMIERSNISKEELVYQQAHCVAQTAPRPHGAFLTIANNRLIPSAGIDESNAEGTYIVYPNDMDNTTVEIWKHLRKQHNIKKLGIVITDSSTIPLRRGVVGVALSWCGFKPLYDYVGTPDLDGRPLSITAINLLDAIAATAVWTMGEGNEQTPLAMIESPPFVEFVDRPPTEQERENICINMDDDLYAPLLQGIKWEPGKK